MQEAILAALKETDGAVGFAMTMAGRLTEPIESISINPNARGHQPVIEFNNGTFISAEILNAATCDEIEITIPGRAIFRLYKRTPVRIKTKIWWAAGK